jgi:hypothetical protein
MPAVEQRYADSSRGVLGWKLNHTVFAAPTRLAARLCNA